MNAQLIFLHTNVIFTVLSIEGTVFLIQFRHFHFKTIGNAPFEFYSVHFPGSQNVNLTFHLGENRVLTESLYIPD